MARTGMAIGGCGPAFVSAVCLSAVSPLSIVLMLATLSPGLGTAQAAWWAVVSGGASLLRRRLRPALLIGANRFTAGLLGLYAAAALLRGFGR